jgi:hypothetical protein
MASTARATAIGAYVEQDPVNAVDVTAVGAYVEQDPANRVQVTALGAYVEYGVLTTRNDTGMSSRSPGMGKGRW